MLDGPDFPTSPPPEPAPAVSRTFFRPRLIGCLRNYSGKMLVSDLGAGVTVGIVALPLAMAFAIASGVSPEAGIFTAVIAGFLISALGGSLVQIGGPTGAFVVILYATLAEYGAANLAICTIMAGVLLLVMGLARLGAVIKFIPYPVTMGFTSAVAVLIASTQIKDFLGLAVEDVPADFVDKLRVLAQHLPTIRWETAGVAFGSLLIIFFWRPKSWAKRIPASVVALVFGTLFVAVFDWPVETIGSRFGGIPQALPDFVLPNFTLDQMVLLIRPAMTIAMLAAIESLLSAVVADGMIDDRHDSDQELMALGIANMVTPLFGGIASTGAIARTATNVRSGGRTPVSGIVHALTLLLIVLVAAPLASNIPLATLSAVLMVVAYNMGEWNHFKRLRKWPRTDAVVFLTTFALTVLVDLTVAIEVGMVLAAILFIKRIADSTQITEVDVASETEEGRNSIVGKEVPDDVQVFRIFGSFSFGVADRLETALKRAGQEPRVLILRMRKVLYMDATGLNALEDLFEKLRNKDRFLVLVGPRDQPRATMDRAGFVARLGTENITDNLDAALDRARELLTPSSASS